MEAMVPESVLVVCMGNICRSPTAEAVLRSAFQKAGLPIEVDSAGTEDYHVGNAPDARSMRYAALRGYDLSRLRARQVRASDFLEFDLIFAADSSNLAKLRRQCPSEMQHKLALFLEDTSLPDPYYGGGDGFDLVLDLVEKRVSELVAAWTQTAD